MIDVLLIAGLSAIASGIVVVSIAVGWLILSVGLDIIEARRKREERDE